MPDTREKLIELICSTEYGNGSLIGNNFQKGFIEKIADHLIADGVTIQSEPLTNCQQWIPVTERMPEDGVPVLVYVYMNNDIQKVKHRGNRWYSTWDNVTEIVYVSHWMPLPEPPKGE